MSEIVFVLGAGASAHCGIPLTKDFIGVARDLLRNGEVDEFGNAFNNVLDAVGKLHAVHSKANLDIDNIESIYTAFEMGNLIGKLPGIKDEERITTLLSAIRKVIGYTLEKTTKVTKDIKINPVPAYFDFTSLLRSLKKAQRTFTIITFNYDLGLEYSLYKSGLVPDYGLDDINITDKCVTYLKLHGSLNFGRCSNISCRIIAPYRQFEYTEEIPNTDQARISVISRLKNCVCPRCWAHLEEDPIIIPHTWNKTAYHEQIDEIWRRAANELSDAEYIFVLGYSLPDTDWFFNYLYGLAVDMETPVKGFNVYNPDLAVKTRFEKLLGQGAIKHFNYSETSFEHAVSTIASALEI